MADAKDRKSQKSKMSGEILLKKMGPGLTIAFFQDESMWEQFLVTLDTPECEYLRKMGVEIVAVKGTPKDLMTMDEEELKSLGLYRVGKAVRPEAH